MSEYTANGNMYGCSYIFANPYSNLHTEPFRTSVKELYSFMLKRCLDRTKEYDDTDTSIDFAVLRLMQKELDATNPLSVILSNDAYYFSDSEMIRRIDKYESS